MRTNRGLLKRALVAVGVAAATTGAIAGIAAATGGSGQEHPAVVASSAPATTPTSAAPSHPSPPTQAMQQTISVAVIGGKMTIAPSNLTLTLNRERGSD